MTLRVDNVGSMLRPPELVDAVARHESGDLSDDGLRVVEGRRRARPRRRAGAP